MSGNLYVRKYMVYSTCQYIKLFIFIICRLFNWVDATLEEIEIFMGLLFLWMAPKEGGNSLGGTRYTPGVLKQIKTKFQNLLTHFLKRKDVDLSSQTMTFLKNTYNMKRNKSGHEPMEGVEGDRQRVAFEDIDKTKLDQWMTKPLDQVCIIDKLFGFILFNIHLFLVIVRIVKIILI